VYYSPNNAYIIDLPLFSILIAQGVNSWWLVHDGEITHTGCNTVIGRRQLEIDDNGLHLSAFIAGYMFRQKISLSPFFLLNGTYVWVH